MNKNSRSFSSEFRGQKKKQLCSSTRTLRVQHTSKKSFSSPHRGSIDFFAILSLSLEIYDGSDPAPVALSTASLSDFNTQNVRSVRFLSAEFSRDSSELTVCFSNRNPSMLALSHYNSSILNSVMSEVKRTKSQAKMQEQNHTTEHRKDFYGQKVCHMSEKCQF